MKYTFTDQLYTNKTNVWYDGIFLGEIFTTMIERGGIDWDKYRSDKTLRMSVRERFEVKYIPSVKINGTPSRVLGTFPSKETAAAAMLESHRSHANGS